MRPTLLFDNDFIEVNSSLESKDLHLSANKFFSNLMDYEFYGETLSELKSLVVNISPPQNIKELSIEIEDLALFFSEVSISSYKFDLDIPKNLKTIKVNISIIDSYNTLYQSTLIINQNKSNKYLKTL